MPWDPLQVLNLFYATGLFLYPPPPSPRKTNLFLDWIHPMFPNFVDWPKYNAVIYWPDFGHITFQNKKYLVLLSIHERFRALSKDSVKEIKCVAFRTRTSYLLTWNITSNFRKKWEAIFPKKPSHKRKEWKDQWTDGRNFTELSGNAEIQKQNKI